MPDLHLTPKRLVALGATAVVLVLLLLVTGDGPQGRTLPRPSSTTAGDEPAPTTEPDYSLVALEAVPGETTTTAPIATGRTTIRGVVTGPDGAVPGAIVRIERLVGDAVQRTDVVADGNGGFVAGELAGGRYRIRAFLSPTLVTTEPEVFFVADGGDREVRLRVEPYTGLTAVASTTPASPVVGGGVNIAVVVAHRGVDAGGVGRQAPLAGVEVEIRWSGLTALFEEPIAVTGPGGAVVFSFRCESAGAVTASVVVGEPQETISLDVPPCGPRPTTTTTTTPGEGDGDGDGDGDGEDDDDRTTTTSEG